MLPYFVVLSSRNVVFMMVNMMMSMNMDAEKLTVEGRY
jgi:hypothetical protein